MQINKSKSILIEVFRSGLPANGLVKDCIQSKPDGLFTEAVRLLENQKVI